MTVARGIGCGNQGVCAVRQSELCLLRLVPDVEARWCGVSGWIGCAELVWVRCHRPEDKAAKKQRLLAEAEAREKGSESDKKKPVGLSSAHSDCHTSAGPQVVLRSSSGCVVAAAQPLSVYTLTHTIWRASMGICWPDCCCSAVY